MRHVLCFGDSNTWGYVPATAGDRFPYEERYPGILQARLGQAVRVHEEGLNGRMSAWDDPLNPDRNALRQIDAILESHRPLDCIVLMLGTNDLKRYMGLEAADCALGQNSLIDRIEAARCGRGGARPEILLVSPPHVVETPTPFGNIFDGAIPKSRQFSTAYAKIALQRGCKFLNAASVAETSVRDGIHLERESHLRLAEAIAAQVGRILEAA